MKRQRGRGRKPGSGGGGGGGSSHNHGNRSIESNGPEVKIRGTAAQIYEKYSQYARDAQSAGDRVKYENLLQHAEHYFRIMVATMPRDRLFQQTGEGGMPMQSQGMQGGEGQPADGSAPVGETADSMKVMDDQAGDDDGDYDNDEGDDRDEQIEAGAGNDDRDNQQGDNQQGDNQQGDRQGRRRRRGRRRHQDGDRNNQPQNAGAQNSGNGGENNNEPREPRSALDSLARRQGAIAGS